MDFSFTDEQEMLRDGVGKFLEKSYDFDTRQKLVQSEAPWSAEAWNQFAEFGLLALPFPEDAGGLGGSISDCVAFAELFGKHLVIEPYVGSIVLCGGAIAASSSETATGWLERIMSGEATAAFAYEEGKGTPAAELIAMRAKPNTGGYELTGEKTLVIGGKQADILVVAARLGDSDELALFLIETDADPSLHFSEFRTIDGVVAANIRFDTVEVPADHVLVTGADEIASILSTGVIVQCAQAVGAMGALLAMTSEYAMTRKQFGVPIGSFQAVAHRLADMKIAFSKARATLIYTTALAESGAMTDRDLAILKGQTGKLGRAIGEAAIQTHGGVGMTDELSVSHYHKHILALDGMFGGHEYHLRKVGMR